MSKLHFVFDRDERSVERVNDALSGLRLSALSIADSKGFLVTRIEYTNDVLTSTRCDYGFDHITFECCRDESETLYTWQLDAQALAKGEIADFSVWQDRWCTAHPDRVMRVMQQTSYSNADAFVVLHHERRA